MPWYHADLHVHSCLSPGGDLSASPKMLVDSAVDAGIQLLALTDTHSARNCPPFAQHARLAGITPVFGLEAISAEGVTVIALFDKLDQAVTYGEQLYGQLPNIPATRQAQVAFDESIVDYVLKLLSSRLPISLTNLVEQIQAQAGLAIPCRRQRGLISWPATSNAIDIDDAALRLAGLGWAAAAQFGDDQQARYDQIFEELLAEIIAIGGKPGLAWNDERLGGLALPVCLVAGSDAYEPQWVGARRTLFYAEAPTFQGLRAALGRGLALGIWPLH